MWLQEVILEGKEVQLIPLRESHCEGLLKAASDGKLWNLWFTSVPSEANIDTYIQTALEEQKVGRALPFTVIDKKTNSIIGSTRYCNVPPTQKRVEIGYTWYAKSHQRTAKNTEAKLLLLSHAFETLQCIAVEFRTHIENSASKNAIARLGAKQDGILRQHQQLKDGSYRDSVVFSILNSEWNAIKQKLENRLN
ncbi:MAG: GNAT family N-acetyltransferase [Flavobacteriaceae bacterium]|nr:GNAT family N-acetyltransferase [Flavobacteriaceae bacterium]